MYIDEVLTDRQVVSGAPIGVHLVKQFGREGTGFHALSFLMFTRLYFRQAAFIVWGAAEGDDEVWVVVCGI
jgi:hypothetical protein